MRKERNKPLEDRCTQRPAFHLLLGRKMPTWERQQHWHVVRVLWLVGSLFTQNKDIYGTIFLTRSVPIPT